MSETIRAKEFIVVDDAGRERAKLGSAEGGVALEMGAADGANVTLAVDDGGATRLEFRSGSRTVRLVIDEHRAQIKLKNLDQPESCCGLTLDGAGAWVYAESTPDVGVRLLSNRGGNGSLLWISEECAEHGEAIVRTRYIHPNPKEDRTGGWCCDR